ncbi:MAG: DUF2249 domain-containing protein [Demequina sp.]
MTQDTADTAKTTGGCACGGGGCGTAQAEPAPASGVEPGDLDVRTIPRERRHATVIGQVTSLVAGEVMVIAAPHAPERLLAEIDADVSGDFSFEYLQRGPDTWRVAISRLTCC